MKNKFLVIIFLSFALSLSVFGCAKSSENSQNENTSSEDTDRTVTLNDVGLKYTTPDEWREYEETNIYPITHKTDDTLAQIKYCYISDTMMQKLQNSEGEPDTSELQDSLRSICEIVIVNKANIENQSVKETFGTYSSVEKVSEQGDYYYYLLTDTKEDLSALTEEEKSDFSKLSEASKKIKDTVKTFDFNPNALAEKEEEQNKVITFDTKTLEGESVSSTVFADYDVTLLNFWQIQDSYPNINESETMQKLYEFSKEHPNVNIIQAIVDLPETDEAAGKQNTALEAKKAVNGQYLSIVMDQTLGTWAGKNLTGIPTTVLIDKDGKIISDQIQGVKDYETYVEAINKALETTGE